MAPELEELLQWTKVDASIAGLTSLTLIPSNSMECLKVQDKKAETSFHKTHLASAWAIKASTAASFFNRASLLWLHQLLARVPPENTRLHQDINKLTAAEFSADATLNAAKFTSRALASNVTSHQLAWFHH